jgi:hypothetical protein
LSTIPSFANPSCGSTEIDALETDDAALALGVMGALATIDIVFRALLGGLMRGNDAGELLASLARAAIAIVLVVNYQWLFSQGVTVANDASAAILSFGSPGPKGGWPAQLNLGKESIGPIVDLLTNPLSWIIDTILAVLTIVAQFALLILKIVLSAATAALFAGGPLLIMLRPLGACRWLTDPAWKLFVVCILVPPGWSFFEDLYNVVLVGPVVSPIDQLLSHSIWRDTPDELIAVGVLVVLIKWPLAWMKQATAGIGGSGTSMLSQATSFTASSAVSHVAMTGGRRILGRGRGEAGAARNAAGHTHSERGRRIDGAGAGSDPTSAFNAPPDGAAARGTPEARPEGADAGPVDTGAGPVDGGARPVDRGAESLDGGTGTVESHAGNFPLTPRGLGSIADEFWKCMQSHDGEPYGGHTGFRRLMHSCGVDPRLDGYVSNACQQLSRFSDPELDAFFGAGGPGSPRPSATQAPADDIHTAAGYKASVVQASFVKLPAGDQDEVRELYRTHCSGGVDRATHAGFCGEAADRGSRLNSPLGRLYSALAHTTEDELGAMDHFLKPGGEAPQQGHEGTG